MTTKNRCLLGFGLSAITAAAFVFAGVAPVQAAEGSILHAGTPTSVKDSYLVALKGEPSKSPGVKATVGSQAGQLAERYGGKVGWVYSATLRGFSVRMTEGAARRLAADPAVRYVEQNAVATVSETWGLDRVDQRDLPLSNSYSAPNDGAGATIYIADTGMDLRHSDYGGRATSGYDFIDNDSDASDCHGHGTHVGGTVGSTTWGIAKKTKLVAVRVLNCQGSGSYDQIIAGINWVTEKAPQAAAGNMSLGGGKSTAVNEAVTKSIDAGVAWAVAAGNENADACTRSPASTPAALTVAASDNQDRRSVWNSSQASNYGSCVDLFAPGTAITSTTQGGGSGAMSGTSMATPHVAGALALEFTGNPGESVADANAKVLNTSTAGKITDLRGSPNKLLYVSELGGAVQPGKPVADFSSSCGNTDRACRFDGSSSRDEGGSISSYRWDFGDGSIGDGVNPSHTYARDGDFTVKLTVTDNDGNTGDVTKTVTVGAPPTGRPPQASFTANCQWAACQFDGSGSTDPDSDIASYVWDFGDGKTGTGRTASHTYPSQQSTYTAKLTVTDRANNAHSATKQIQCWSFGAQAFCFSQ